MRLGVDLGGLTQAANRARDEMFQNDTENLAWPRINEEAPRCQLREAFQVMESCPALRAGTRTIGVGKKKPRLGGDQSRGFRRTMSTLVWEEPGAKSIHPSRGGSTFWQSA